MSKANASFSDDCLIWLGLDQVSVLQPMLIIMLEKLSMEMKSGQDLALVSSSFKCLK